MLPDKPVYLLGIDTGGTYTDAVLLEVGSQKIRRAVKVLTTHYDLRICIAQALDQVVPDEPGRVAFVSLSTTLATNAIAEGKRKPVGLLLVGYDPGTIYQYGFDRELGTPHFRIVAGRINLEGQELSTLDENEVLQAAGELAGVSEALAVAAYAGMVDSRYEERAAALAAGRTGLPVVQAHHLSSELDSIRRATTASLNASLLSNLQAFLSAVQEMLARRGMSCPVRMVRGDGSVVSAEFARSRPVEIIHSGPATSAIGGQFLAGLERALVVDIGGTTTDLTLIDQGRVQARPGLATVGPYRTCVQTIQAHSFGLGGDSQIAFDHHHALSLGPGRAIPVSRLCAQHPQVRQDLFAYLAQKGELHYSDEIEYWVLRRLPSRPLANPRAQKAIELLQGGPLRLGRLLEAVGARSAVLLDADELVRREIMDRSALTPTDLLHLTGEFTPWDGEAAGRVTAAAARLWDETPAAFIQRIRQAITHRAVAEIIQFLSRRSLSAPTYLPQQQELDRWLFEESLVPRDPFLGSRIFLKLPLVAIGAPARAFLPSVAEALGTEIFLPEHYQVANAIGAVVGNVVVHKTAEVFPLTVGMSIGGYFARVDNTQESFPTFETACSYARQTLLDRVRAEAQAAGAVAPQVTLEEQSLWDGMINLSAWAIGKP